jgi:hypothetical protein
MSILSALKQQNSSIDDLAKLPQAMIMQMAQKKQISQDMLAPILARKAEMMDAVSRSKALQNTESPPSIMEQVMAKNIEAENPANTVPKMPQQAPNQLQAIPQAPEEAGVAQLPIPERQYAGGGIVAFAKGDLIDLDEDEDENDILAEYAQAMAEGERAVSRGADMPAREMPTKEMPAQNSGVGLRYKEPQGGSQGIRQEMPDADQARKYNVGNLRPSGFTYPGQIGLSKGKFAMFDSPEAGIAALQQDIGIKLNRGLDTPEKFISVYAPASDKNDVKAYSKNVAKMLGIDTNDKIPNTPEAKQLLANAIIRQEGAHKATANFAHGGDVRHFFNEGYVDPFGAPSQDYDMDTLRVEQSKAAKKRKEDEDKLEFLKQNAPELAAKIAPPAKAVPVVNAPAVNKYPTDQEFKDFDQAAALFQAENMGKNIPAEQTSKAAVPKNELDTFLEEVAQGRKDLAEQRKEDKNMALLAAGLGMLGGGSQYAFENIGKGGLSGVQYLSEANKQRAAEKAALDKSQVTALRYKDLAEISKGGRESLLGLRMGELNRKIRDDNMEAIGRLEKNSLAKATAALKSQGLLGTDLNDPKTQDMLTEWVNRDLANNKAYNKLHQETFGFAFDVAPQASGGSGVRKYDSKGKEIK